MPEDNIQHINTREAILLSAAAGRNLRLRKLIDKTFAQIQPQDLQPDKCFNHTIFHEMSMESELYARRAYNILANGLFDLAFWKTGWPELYSYLLNNKSDEFDFAKFSRYYVMKNGGNKRIDDDTYNDTAVVAIILCMLSNIKTVGQATACVEDWICTHLHHIEHPLQLTKADASIARKLAKSLSINNITDIEKTEAPNRMYALSGLPIPSIYDNVSFMSKDVQMACEAFVLEVDASRALDLAESPLWRSYMISLIHQRVLIRAYLLSKQSFFKHLSLHTAAPELERQWKDTQEQMELLTQRLTRAQDECVALERERKRQDEELADLKAENEQLKAEYEMLKAALAAPLEETIANEQSWEDMISRLQQYKAVFVGGHESIRRRLAELLPKYSFYAANAVPIPALTNADIVFFHPIDSSHGAYYRLLANVPREKIRIVNLTNIDLLIGQMSRLC